MSKFAISIAALFLVQGADAITIGQIDTFEGGTAQNWIVNLLGMGAGAPQPTNIPDGGPGGAGDNFLRLTSLGGQGAGGRLVAINVMQWTGNYTAAGVSRISMSLRNLGTTDLAIRLYLENPNNAPPTDDAVTNAVLLAAGGGWTNAIFDVTPGALTGLNGNVNTLLSNVTAVRIMHGTGAAFPPAPIVAVLGVDNVTAAAADAVPEPASLLLTLAGTGVLFLMRPRKRRSQPFHGSVRTT